MPAVLLISMLMPMATIRSVGINVFAVVVDIANANDSTRHINLSITMIMSIRIMTMTSMTMG